MINIQFDVKQVNGVKEILLNLNKGQSSESIRTDIEQYFEGAKVVDILLTELELINRNHGITNEDLIELSRIYPHLYSNSLSEELKSQTNYPGHPVQVLIEENKILHALLDEITLLFDTYEKSSSQKAEIIDEIKQKLRPLGEFNNHYNRKEKLFFPIMERYGYVYPPKLMWKKDDEIRAFFKALNMQIKQLPELDFVHVRKTYNTFEKEFKEMIFQEEALILPVLQSTFSEDDWLTIAKESSAFGFVSIEPEKEWIFKSQAEKTTENEHKATEKENNTIPRDKNIPFGGGYLTIEEANLILNNLPVEITYVDKNSVFKYFNEMTKSSEMMLVRTPISIGRNVANCHPPKSLGKVMTLVRDLKAKRRTSESMWFKKGDEYIHLTYKPLFNEKDEFLGILEYVQDIQPFLNLPSEIKRGLSKIEE